MARNTAIKNTEMSRQAGKAKATDSTLANLPGKTDTPTVRAARPAALNLGKNYTGQYLYDRFVNDKAENKADITKMGIVQQMVDVLDAPAFGKVVADMVTLTQKDVETAVRAAKEAGNYDSEKPTLAIREANARLKTARNHQTVMRTAFGALKFCADELKKVQGDAELSYRMIREIGSRLLADKGINWDGTKAEQRESRQARKEQEEETKAMLEVQKEMPRKEGESRADYYARIDAGVTKKMKERAEEQRKKVVEMLAQKFRDMAGENLPDIIEALMSPQPDNKNEPAVVVATPDGKLH